MSFACNRAAYQAFSLAHDFAQPVHRSIYQVYSLISEREGSVVSLIVNLFFSIVTLPLSLFFSSVGAVLLKCSGKSYLFEKIHPDMMKASATVVSRVFSYNVGFLPGKLAEKLTVGDFPYSSEERGNRIATLLSDSLGNHDVILLEEAVDFGLVRRISKAIKERSGSAFIYSRISKNPLALGIASGLCIISKLPLADLQVGSLPGNEPFFNRAYVRFKLPNETQVVHSHLRAGSDEEPRFMQLGHIARSLIDHVGMLIGDYNFGDRARDQIAERVPLLENVRHYLNEPSMREVEENDTHPDLATTFGGLRRRVGVQVHRDIHYSDHLPFSVQC